MLTFSGFKKKAGNLIGTLSQNGGARMEVQTQREINEEDLCAAAPHPREVEDL